MLGEVVAGVLVDVVAATGRRLTISAATLRGRRYRNDLELARWFDTYKITDPAPDLCQIPPGTDEVELAGVLHGAEVHAVLHELLAARLTGAPAADVEHVRAAFSLTLDAALPHTDTTGLAFALFSYYDSETAGLIKRLKATRADLLREVREEAFGARMIATLQAIERHVAALSARPGRQTEADFLARYRRHITEYHGMLEPPDFERRQRVSIAGLYVPPVIVQMIGETAVLRLREITLRQFAQEVDRTVLLGDPGSGKTTAAHVLMYTEAADPAGHIPFLVTLRDFTSGHSSRRAVAGHLADQLETLYQCPAPPGTVERLLLSGAALVIFDGLDELADTARRAEASAIIERFCTEYPLARVLVTSRLTGYEQARLEDRYFTRYRIGGFD
ncbi:MAG: NACHT domain-containing protein [Candidatus Sulfotelmatobacter sp.]